MNACPHCRGEKGGVAHINTGPDRPHEWGWLPCSTCAGTGEVSDEHLARIERGNRVRAERLARDESLREAAKRMGITAAELSAIERGIDKDGI